jgi:hypothetical protein
VGNDWLERVERWRELANEAGLGGIIDSLGVAFQPLSPLAAQLLWIAQPTLNLFGEAERVGELADFLDQLGSNIEDSSPASKAG